jgi:hypothetical protein
MEATGTKRPPSGQMLIADSQFDGASQLDAETPLFERLQRIADAAAASGSDRSKDEGTATDLVHKPSLTADSLMVLLSQALEAQDNVCLPALHVPSLC